MKEVWSLLSSKVHLQKVLEETGAVEKAANHEAFQVEGLELGYGYVLNNGNVEHEGLLGLSVHELLKDLVETLGKENDPYKVVAELITNGYKIEIDSKEEIYYYSRFHSPGRFPLNPEYTFEEATFEEAKQAIRELEMFELEMLNVDEDSAVELIDDIYTSIDQVNEVRNLTINEKDVMKEVWSLLSSKVHLQKVFVETGTVEKAANHEAFQVEGLELGYGYVLNNGTVERKGLLGLSVYELLKDLVETLGKENDPYKVVAELITDGYKIEISEDEIYFYSKFHSPDSGMLNFHSPGRFPLNPEYTFEEAKRAIRELYKNESYKKRVEYPLKGFGFFNNPKDCEKIIKDDKAFQYIEENEFDLLAEYIMEMLNKDDYSAAKLIRDLYTELDLVNKVRNNRMLPPLTINEKDLMKEEVWSLLSSKVHLQKVLVETGTVEKAAKHEAFQVEGLELGYGYVLNNGTVEREGILGLSVYELLKDLVETLGKESDPYKVVAELIIGGYKIEVDSKEEISYYSKFHSPARFPLNPEYTFEEAKREIRKSYKQRIEIPSKGAFHNPEECKKIIEDDKAFQYIVENEIYYLGEYLEEMLNIDSAVELIEDLYTSLDQVNEVRNNRMLPPLTINEKDLNTFWDERL